MKDGAARLPTHLHGALEDRDAWYDGLIYALVHTTGVYCRPSCPARTPRPENVAFAGSADEAEQAGYRPCRRCAPASGPWQSPAWLPPRFRELLAAQTDVPAGRGAGHQADSPTLTVSRIATPLGVMVAAASNEGLCLLEFSDRRMLATQVRRLRKRLGCRYVPGVHPLLERTSAQLAEYFAGSRSAFSVPLDLPGSPFQRSVWTRLSGVPYGSTVTYADLAQAIGRANAGRAVGRANGDNRVAILVPCHRVVGSDGALRGYGGKLWRKQRLLELEARTAAA